MDWYAYVDGKRYGPVDTESLRGWIAAGRLHLDHMVWRQGLADWTPAGNIPELIHGSMPPPVPAGPPPAVPPLDGGTGGQSTNAELTAHARELLRGNWGTPIGFSFLLFVINSAVGSIPGIGGLASLVLAGPLALGGVIFYLNLTRGGMPKIGMLLAGFKTSFVGALVVNLLVGIFVFLWTLLLIIPGFIAAMSYSQAMYILADNPRMDGLEAIRRSKKLMKGHIGKLGYLYLRFFGWSLLCVLTIGIGYLWLVPYISTTMALFYNDLQPPVEGSSVEETITDGNSSDKVETFPPYAQGV